MKLSQVKLALKELKTIGFQLPNGTLVPQHFHVTEIGKITKHFIDCGGTERKEEVASFQLWNANDYDHRLHPNKLLNIIELSQKLLKMGDLDIEVEYQTETIGKFGLDFNGKYFKLTHKQTDCLAKNNCGIPKPIPQVKTIKSPTLATNNCTPGGGCC